MSQGMRMNQILPGMRLRSVLELERGGPSEFITVVLLTSKGFIFSYDQDIPLGVRLGVQLIDGNEHFGIDGYSLYEQVPPVTT